MQSISPGTCEHVAGPESANAAQERQQGNSDEKIKGQIKIIDGISNMASSRRDELDWDIISNMHHCLTVPPHES